MIITPIPAGLLLLSTMPAAACIQVVRVTGVITGTGLVLVLVTLQQLD